jgi:hypothetical protein
MKIEPTLKSPFPYFGGKRTVALLVWDALGDVSNYVEPFLGSAAVLLSRPHEPKIETVNDMDGWLCNFWRALAADPEAVAHYADWPVSELDLHARGDWLFYRPDAAQWVEKMRADPDFYDAKSAGWWVWGACAWIGSGWGPRMRDEGKQRQLPRQLPHPGNAGRGINRKLPHLGNAGRGINRQLPHLGNAGRGINRQLPHLGDAGQGIKDYFKALSDRLRRVRVCCGDWSRVCGPSVTVKHGLTGVFLDPPYAAEDRADCYNHESRTVSADVRAWAIANGDNPLMRIVLAGYEGEHAMPRGWRKVAWKTRGGFGSQAVKTKNVNGAREMLWFSPHCLTPDQGELF